MVLVPVFTSQNKNKAWYSIKYTDVIIGGNASEDCSAATQNGSFKTKRTNRNVIASVADP
jgi:hypothetical protein